MPNDRLRLRTIVVSGRSALETVHDPIARQLIQSRILALLSDLEARVTSEGADPDMLARIERMQRVHWA